MRKKKIIIEIQNGDYISEDGAFGSKPWYKKEGGKDFPAQFS